MAKQRTTRKLLSVLLSLTMIVALFAGLGITASAYSGGSGTAASPYLITTQADLNGFAAALTSSNDYANTYFQLTASGLSVTAPIGSATIISDGTTSSPTPTTGDKGFAGNFDGNGQSITVNINTTGSGVGLFRYIAPAGVVQNLTVTGSVTVTGSCDAVGGVAGYNSGTINKVTNNATVTASSGSTYNIGGIAGFNNAYYPRGATNLKGIIVNSVNTAAVTGMNKVGGITGENAGTISSSSNSGKIDGTNASSKNGVGGIAGRAGNNNTAEESSFITNCLNSGEVGRSGQKWVGGITGFANAKSVIVNCLSVGTIVQGAGNDNPIAGQQEGKANLVYCDDALYYTSAATSIIERGFPMDLATQIQTASFADQLDEQSKATGIWNGGNGVTPYLMYAAAVPTPGGGGNSGNTLSVVYLDNINGNDGNGHDGSTLALAVKTLGKATEIADLSSVPSVYVSVATTVTVSGTESVYSAAKLKWEPTAGAAAPMFNIAAGGDLTIGGLNINGNGVTTALNVIGDLTVRNNASVTNCGTAIDVQSGGDLRLNRSTIGGTNYSVRMESGAGTFTIYTSNTQYVTLSSVVYLATSEYISVESTLANMTSNITVEMANPVANQIVAQVAGTYAAFAVPGDMKFSYSGGAHTFKPYNNNTQIVINT
jgi:hypothetical protein